MNYKRLIGTARSFTRRNSPTILTAFAITTSVGAMIMSAFAQHKAEERVVEASETEAGIDEAGHQLYICIPPSRGKIVGIYADEFAPAALVEVAAITSIVVLLRTCEFRISGLTSALAIKAAEAKTLENKVSEEDKQTIREDGVDETLKEIGELPSGSYLFKDPHYNMYLISTEKDFLRAVNAANSIFVNESFVTIGTFYYYWDRAAPNASMVEGWTQDQVINDWGEVTIPIDVEKRKTKAGAVYFEIQYNSEIRPVLTDAKDILEYYD